MAVFGIGAGERRKAVPGYGGRYEVSDRGRVFSGGMELSLIRGRYVNLCWKGGVSRVDVAYLVARAFVPNVEGRPYVEHLDGDVENCRAENLAWVEEKVERRGRHARKVLAVVQYGLDGAFVARYGSVAEASDATGVARSLIRGCAEGRTGRARSWIFRYEI